MPKETVHTVQRLPGKIIVTRHKQPKCVITFNQQGEVVAFESADSQAQEKLVILAAKALAFARSPLSSNS